MKNTITNFALVLAAFVAVNLLMSFARPVAAPDEPKQYIIVTAFGQGKFEQAVNEKLTEGWHLQGGVHLQAGFGGGFFQAMAK